jgi:hypothetical protein
MALAGMMYQGTGAMGGFAETLNHAEEMVHIIGPDIDSRTAGVHLQQLQDTLKATINSYDQMINMKGAPPASTTTVNTQQQPATTQQQQTTPAQTTTQQPTQQAAPQQTQQQTQQPGLGYSSIPTQPGNTAMGQQFIPLDAIQHLQSPQGKGTDTDFDAIFGKGAAALARRYNLGGQ